MVSLFADTEVRLLASGAYAHADVLVPYLFMSALLFGVYIFAPGLTIAKRTGTFASISVSAGLLNLGLALALIPSLGIRGAGLATAASSAWFFVLTMFFSQRHYAVGHGWMRLGAALVVAIGLVALGRAVIPIGGIHALAAWPLMKKAILSGVGGVAIAALLVHRGELTWVWIGCGARFHCSGERLIDLQQSPGHDAVVVDTLSIGPRGQPQLMALARSIHPLGEHVLERRRVRVDDWQVGWIRVL